MPASQTPGPRSVRVLVIEAEASVRRALRLELAEAGFEILEAADGGHGVQLLRDGGADIALLGRCADGRAARELLSLVLRACGPRPPACALIAREGDGEILACLAAGADDLLPWPAAAGHAAARVRLMLRSRACPGRERSARGDTAATGPGLADEELVGVLGRQGVVQHLARALVESARRETHVGVLCVDLSQFKVVTGALTHETGTDLLAQIVERLREGLRRDDLLALLLGDDEATRIARLRSDELTLLLPDLRRPSDTLEVGRRILRLLDEPFLIEGREVFVTVSIGAACSPSDGVSPEELLKHAETATLCARQQGRHTVLAYTPAMDARAFERLTLETGLRRALDRDELVVHYQPRVELATGKLIGLEALVRWRHPDQGLVAPAQFISLAEETGLIVPIGAWVLRQSCEQNRAWQQAGLPPVRLSVNISSVQFRQPDLYDLIMRTLAETQLEPRWLELELTESLLMQNPEDVVVLLERLSGQGIHLSIDDFGTGYSSLS